MACELMCNPSASSAMELSHQPPMVYTTIIAAVTHITVRILRSAGLPTPKTCSCVQEDKSCVCMVVFWPSDLRRGVLRDPATERACASPNSIFAPYHPHYKKIDYRKDEECDRMRMRKAVQLIGGESAQ